MAQCENCGHVEPIHRGKLLSDFARPCGGGCGHLYATYVLVAA